MAKNLGCVPLFLFFMSGCGMMAIEAELPTTEPQAAPIPEQSPMFTPALPVQSSGADSQAATVQSKTPTTDEIKLLQAQLKTAGFDPGPADGIMGPRTTSALLRLQSGCSTLKDLAQSEMKITRTSSTAEAAASTARPIAGTDEIRLAQVRLKDAGFDPGPIDGILGPKTRSAFNRLGAGCSALKDFAANFHATTERGPGVQSFHGPSLASSSSSRLHSTPSATGNAVASGSKSSGKEEIRLVQVRLRNAGFDPGPIDGILGPKTRSAIKRYQSANRRAGDLPDIAKILLY